MEIGKQVAQHFRQVYFGGNWTDVNLKETLSNIRWEEASKKNGSLNTILALTCHIYYYVQAVLNVLKGGPLDASDKLSWDHFSVSSQENWEELLEKFWKDAESFAEMVEKIPDQQLFENMADPKYGTWYRNLHGIVEHTHYHLGQIVLMKKLLVGDDKAS